MRSVGGGCVSCLLLFVLWTGTGYSLEYSPPPALSADGHAGDRYGSIDKADSRPSLSCADVAYTDIFRARRLEYVHSPEFAEAVRFVVSGASRYSPAEIPAAWTTIATEWSRHLGSHREGAAGPAVSAEFTDDRAGDGGLHLLREGESLAPALVYLASMEYRSRRGHEDVTPVFPWVLRQAYADLDNRVAAKRQSAKGFSKRAAAIAAKISDAERKGAGDDAPDLVTRAKSALDCACRDAMGFHASVRETEAAFDSAERAAEAISARDRYRSKGAFGDR